MENKTTINVEDYIELQNKINRHKTLNYKQKEVIDIQKQYIENQEKIIDTYVKRLKEYAEMLASRETTMHEIVDCLIVKEKLQILECFIGEIPNRLN